MEVGALEDPVSYWGCSVEFGGGYRMLEGIKGMFWRVCVVWWEGGQVL